MQSIRNLFAIALVSIAATACAGETVETAEPVPAPTTARKCVLYTGENAACANGQQTLMQCDKPGPNPDLNAFYGTINDPTQTVGTIWCLRDHDIGPA